MVSFFFRKSTSDIYSENMIFYLISSAAQYLKEIFKYSPLLEVQGTEVNRRKNRQANGGVGKKAGMYQIDGCINGQTRRLKWMQALLLAENNVTVYYYYVCVFGYNRKDAALRNIIKILFRQLSAISTLSSVRLFAIIY